jgi:hypothetical protein
MESQHHLDVVIVIPSHRGNHVVKSKNSVIVLFVSVNLPKIQIISCINVYPNSRSSMHILSNVWNLVIGLGNLIISSGFPVDASILKSRCSILNFGYGKFGVSNGIDQ